MELEALKIGGPLALALIVILIIVREFLKWTTNRDTEFTKIITNHIQHDLDLHEKTIEVMNEMKDAQREQSQVNSRLLDFLISNFKK